VKSTEFEIMQLRDFKKAYPELVEKLVLSVDDNEMNQMVIVKIMEKAGMKTVVAQNGAEAISKLKGGLKPDFILMDLEMPVMNGVQSSEWIKKNISDPIPIIINSGAISDSQKWKLKRLGIMDFLEKPYSLQDIFGKLSKNSSTMV
jgi:CheY-like chemotaxis protein